MGTEEYTTCVFDLLVFATFGEIITHQALCGEEHPGECWAIFKDGCPHKDICGVG